MSEEKDFEKKIEDLKNSKEELVPKGNYFDKIWNTIEYKSPVGHRYYLRFVFSAIFVMFFIVFFFIYYSDFLSTVLTLEKIQKENLRFVPVIKYYSQQDNRSNMIDKTEVIEGLKIESIIKSKYKISKSSGKINIQLFTGHIRIDNKALLKSNRADVICPDISITLINGVCDVFFYDNIIRIIPIDGVIMYKFKSKKKELKVGNSLFLLDRKKILLY